MDVLLGQGENKILWGICFWLEDIFSSPSVSFSPDLKVFCPAIKWTNIG